VNYQLLGLFTLVVAIGQPYFLEVAQEVTVTTIVRSKKAARNLFFIFRVFLVLITPKFINYFAKTEPEPAFFYL
jgi:hypothetical protein